MGCSMDVISPWQRCSGRCSKRKTRLLSISALASPVEKAHHFEFVDGLFHIPSLENPKHLTQSRCFWRSFNIFCMDFQQQLHQIGSFFHWGVLTRTWSKQLKVPLRASTVTRQQRMWPTPSAIAPSFTQSRHHRQWERWLTNGRHKEQIDVEMFCAICDVNAIHFWKWNNFYIFLWIFWLWRTDQLLWTETECDWNAKRSWCCWRAAWSSESWSFFNHIHSQCFGRCERKSFYYGRFAVGVNDSMLVEPALRFVLQAWWRGWFGQPQLKWPWGTSKRSSHFTVSVQNFIGRIDWNEVRVCCWWFPTCTRSLESCCPALGTQLALQILGWQFFLPFLYTLKFLVLHGLQVMHVAARALAGQALSIFGDHSDVMACRSTGWFLKQHRKLTLSFSVFSRYPSAGTLHRVSLSVIQHILLDLLGACWLQNLSRWFSTTLWWHTWSPWNAGSPSNTFSMASGRATRPHAKQNPTQRSNSDMFLSDDFFLVVRALPFCRPPPFRGEGQNGRACKLVFVVHSLWQGEQGEAHRLQHNEAVSWISRSDLHFWMVFWIVLKLLSVKLLVHHDGCPAQVHQLGRR